MTTPKIENYRFGEIIIDGRRYARDVIIFPDRVRPEWWREEGHSLSLADLEEVLDEPPEVLVIGQGAQGRMDVPRETREALEQAGINVVVAKTGDAVHEYNQICQGQRAVAALHLTC